jgi:DNA replication and repair protein RecF
MKISAIELKDFRNYKTAKISLCDGLNILTGKNASGKTNMLESVYFSSVFKSPRTSKDKEMILIDRDKATIKLNIEKRFGKHTLYIQIDSQGKKKVLLDNLPVNRAGELLGILGVVLFSPDEMKLVKDAPAERRRFLDVGLSQQQKSYFTALQRYNKTLKQKNNLLKDRRYSQNIDAMLDVWDAGLAKEGATIVEKRDGFVRTLDGEASLVHSKLSGGSEKLSLSYECSAKFSSSDDIEKRLAQAIASAREKDKELGYCSVGPHRDDIKIEINGGDVRKFASQGQQRTVALAMKLGEAALYKKETGETPVLLLDDVLSELDLSRKNILLDCASGLQCILTCTEYELEKPACVFEISNGEIKKIN